MDRSDFLLEISCEELPVSYCMPALGQLASDFRKWAKKARLDHGEIESFATPRRLAILVRDLELAQEDLEEELTGPPVAAAFRDGNPTPAAEGFARGQGVSLEDLLRVETPKGEYLALHRKVPGRAAGELLAESLPALIPALRFPKTMIWGEGEIRFARPIRAILALLGEELISFRLGSLESGRLSPGHFRLSPEPFAHESASHYKEKLAGAGIMADPEERESAILRMAKQAAEGMGGRLLEDRELLKTLSFLLESPFALAGKFSDDFLDLPRDVIVIAMKSHQRYFSVENAEGELLPGFVFLTNGEVKDPASVIQGNERVLQARLEDARFYWQEDLRLGMKGLQERLESVLWMEGFGSLADRSSRIGTLSKQIMKLLPGFPLDEEALDWAARYCKADLGSEMIRDGKEFTRLQGTMGMNYALREGASETAALAIREHYFPRFATDRLPEGGEGILLSLADRLDSICGFWAAGYAPTGSKDPYALRRQALALLRILVGRELPLCLSDLLDLALSGYENLDREAIHPELLGFFQGRLEGLLEEESVPGDIFRAALLSGETRILDLRARALALSELRGDEAFEQLVIGARRVNNLLSREKIESTSPDAWLQLEAWSEGKDTGVREELLKEEAEKALYSSLQGTAGELLICSRDRDYAGAYRHLAALGPRIDAFFDGVMVLSEEEALRTNRLQFLSCLADIFRYYAGFSEVVLEGEREDSPS
ncbi:MAG: glycine--tRNA ligase subunit beta [Candidatus Krumholzibacteria bacterium]|jgi:glycyl-tRNA synthetase beta chain|nr:glycine--tRNA ligase subunit beta [Candidatus Krumholzibacteria bacterium]MDP6669796.1 glycine--tRNA ligase subunit beta [Candidatus Krumholzibacteria bacterium]